MSSSFAPDVSVIIANWNGARLLEACLNSLYDHTRDVRFEIIVADDYSTDRSVELVRTRFPNVIVHTNTKNLGFVGTNNAALPLIRGRHLLLLNNDTVLQNDALTILATELDRNPRAGIAGGTLLNSDGSLQHAYGSFPSIATELGALLSLKPRTVFKNWPRLAQLPVATKTPRKVDYVVGADLMIRTQLAYQLGLFDPGFEAYFEDTDLCRRAKKAGADALYVSAARITHLVGQSYAKDEETVSEKKIRLFERGFTRFCRQHYSPLHARLIVSLRAAFFRKKIAGLKSRLWYEHGKRRPRIERTLLFYRLSLVALKGAMDSSAG